MAERRSPSWLVVFPAIYLLGVCLALLALGRDVVLAGHPAYPIILAAVAAGALVGLVRALRPRPAASGTGRRWVGVAWRAALALLAVALGAALLWLRPFAASPVARDALRAGDGVAVGTSAGLIALLPREPARVGLIFYPGARVDPRAYAATLRPLAAQGYAVFIVKEPLNIAFLATGAAAGVIADHPEIGAWAVGGHSLGGVVAARAAADRPDRVRGLLLYASYPAGDLSAALVGTAVVSVSGSNDGLATPATIAATRSRLPATARYVVIEGGTHAFFGDYGAQPGDGQPTIDREVARAEIVAASLDLLRQIGAAGP